MKNRAFPPCESQKEAGKTKIGSPGPGLLEKEDKNIEFTKTKRQ